MVNCDGCRTKIDEGEEAYCANCYGILEKDVSALEEKISQLEDEIIALEADLDFVRWGG